MYRGDIKLGSTIDIKFTSRNFSTGAPFTLAGSPVISAYVGNGTTEITAGITLTVDFDSRTGLNNVRVVASGGNGFATATDVQLVITTGTVNSVSVVGEVVAEFSIENRRADVQFWNGTQVATPATAGVPDVNVKNINNVSASSVTTVNANQGTTQPVNFTGSAGSALVKGDMVDVAGAVVSTSSAQIGVNVINVAGTAQTARDLGLALPAAAPQAAGGLITSTAGAFDVDEMNFDIESIEALVTALPATIMVTALQESYATDGAGASLAQILYMIYSTVAQFDISGTTLTTRKLDGTTSAMVFTLDSATEPTSRVRSS